MRSEARTAIAARRFFPHPPFGRPLPQAGEPRDNILRQNSFRCRNAQCFMILRRRSSACNCAIACASCACAWAISIASVRLASMRSASSLARARRGFVDVLRADRGVGQHRDDLRLHLEDAAGNVEEQLLAAPAARAPGPASAA